MTGLFASFFPQPSFRSWVLCAAVIFGLQFGLGSDDLALIQECTGLTPDLLPAEQAKRVALIVARRGGKSKFASFLAVFLACFKDYSRVLSPGERGIGMLIAPDRRQAKTCFRYIEAFIDSSPMLAAMVESRTKEAIHLKNGISIEVHTASFRAVRGFTIVFCIVDEAAFLPTDESAEPDVELLTAVMPAMSTVPDAMLILISSPYAKRGELYRAFKECYGKPDGHTLVWKAPTRLMNPTVSEHTVAQALKDDPSRAEAEWLGEFRRDIESFVSREVVEACVAPSRFDLPPISSVKYGAFVDVASGTSAAADDYVLVIYHREGESKVVIDLVFVKRPPFSPEQTTEEAARILKTYGIRSVTGDRYAGEYPREQFRKFGIEYRLADRSKSEIYRDFLPLLNSGRIELPDNARLISQIVGLERRVARGGRDSIDHAPGSHDDLANAVAGAAVHGTVLHRGPSVATITADVEWQRSRWGDGPTRDPVAGALEDALNAGALLWQVQKGL